MVGQAAERGYEAAGGLDGFAVLGMVRRENLQPSRCGAGNTRHRSPTMTCKEENAMGR